MIERKTVSLARALKEKNRLIKKINDFESQIISNNLYQDMDEETSKKLNRKTKKIDVISIFEKRIEAINVLAELKAIIAEANSKNGITKFIYKKEENKSAITFLTHIPSPISSSEKYEIGEEKVVYVATRAQINDETIEKMKNKFSEEIYELQDKIDELNATIKVEIPFYE